MKAALLAVLLLITMARASAQCPASGTQIESAWINPAGTYLDLGSKRPLGRFHHKIFDLRTNKFVATGSSFDERPVVGYGFVHETGTRFRTSDFTNWSDYYTAITISKDGKEIFRRNFTKYAHLFYDTVHGRGLVTEPSGSNSYKLWYLQEGTEPELIDKNYDGSTTNGTFSPDGRYAVISGGTIIDMNSKKMLSKKLGVKKWSPWATIPVVSPDSRYMAITGRVDRTGPQTMLVFELDTRKLVRQLTLPDSISDKNTVIVYPVPDMARAVVVIRRKQSGADETGTAYVLSETGLEPLCYPGWRRERDEYFGKTTTVYDDAASETGACPLAVAAMEADGKWTLTLSGQSAVLYLSARATGAVSGNYTYSKDGTTMKGKITAKLTASQSGTACVHTITGTFDESLFGGAKGTITLTLGTGGKTFTGTAGSAAWSGRKD